MNTLAVDSRWGLRSFTLRHGDLGSLPGPVSVLALSSIGGDLLPTPGSLAGALLDRFGMDAAAEAADPALDFRSALSCWVSGPLEGAPFERILCVDLPPGGEGAEEILRDFLLVLPILEARGMEVRSLALPLLGSGEHGLAPEAVLRPILAGARRALLELRNLETVVFFEHDAGKVELLADAMDAALGRPPGVLADGDILVPLRGEVLTQLRRLAELLPLEAAFFEEQGRRLGDAAARASVVCHAGRLLAERTTDAASGDRGKGVVLFERISKLKEKGVAPWVVSYLHLLRTFGNEVAHVQPQGRTPPALRDRDIAACFFAVQRVLDFLVARIEEEQAGGGSP